MEEKAGGQKQLSQELFEGFLQNLSERGRSLESVKIYRQILKRFYDYLPEGKWLCAESGPEWKQWLKEQGFSARTVNARISVLNSLCLYLGKREWIQDDFSYEHAIVQPELTREEYLRLLRAARELGKERSYLLIKTIGGAGLCIRELPQLTAEAVQCGTLELESHNHRRRRVLHLPAVLQEELLRFLRREGIKSGPVFSAGKGAALGRSSIYYYVNCVSGQAQVAVEKATPRCLWKMYQNTYAGIRANIDFLTEQAYERLLHEEQRAAGWDEREG